MIERLSRAKAIIAKCIDCCCGQKNEVKLCPARDCPLWEYRMGREDLSEYDPKITQAIIESRKNNGFSAVFQADFKNDEE